MNWFTAQLAPIPECNQLTTLSGDGRSVTRNFIGAAPARGRGVPVGCHEPSGGIVVSKVTRVGHGVLSIWAWTAIASFDAQCVVGSGVMNLDRIVGKDRTAPPGVKEMLG